MFVLIGASKKYTVSRHNIVSHDTVRDCPMSPFWGVPYRAVQPRTSNDDVKEEIYSRRRSVAGYDPSALDPAQVIRRAEPRCNTSEWGSGEVSTKTRDQAAAQVGEERHR